MFLCGSNFVGGNLACAITPTGIKNINYIELSNGIYDDLFVTKDVEFNINNIILNEWDFNTILYAKFNNSTNAGNVDWNLQTVSHVILKSRKVGTFKWKTIAVKEVHSIEDFIINYSDYSVASGEEREYAIVPVYYGTEGNYSTSVIKPKYDKMFIIEGDTVWGTPITDGFCDTTRNIPSSTIELLNSKYPIFIRNTIANYDTGTCTGSFVPTTGEDNCNLAYDKEYDYQRITYQKEFIDFLSDGVPKILKLQDGRMWIIQIMPNPTDNADAVYNNRKITFSWVEIGDVNSEEDLYYLGLSDVSPEWWSQ